MQDDYKVITGDNGEVRGITGGIKTSNLSSRQFASMLKKMGRDKKNKFLKECRVVSILPMYLPEGDFAPNETALSLNKDQIKWFQKRRPDFNCE